MGEHGTWTDFLYTLPGMRNLHDYAQGYLGREKRVAVFADSHFSLTHVFWTIVVVLIVLYGGRMCEVTPFACANGNVGSRVDYTDTWEWNGATWSQVPVNGPPHRVGAPLVWDPIRQKLVLEIAAAPPRVTSVAATRPEPRIDCMIGEKLRNRWLGP